MNYSKTYSQRRSLLAGSATLALAAAVAAAPAHAVVPNENTDSEEIVDDEEEFEGVGQFFRSDGFVCTGTLINPRTVLFAAHCVNDRPESDYGTTVASAFSFNFNALPGLQSWFANGFASNPDLNVFNISRINYDPRSLENPAAGGFIEADIALATLDTPAPNLPTWALLFSPLPDPGAIDPVTGTGYHVNITGFGGTGNATQGPIQGIDFRRRAAENMLGSLSSIADRNGFLFGTGSGAALPQNLYNLDFDDPNETSPFDFNVYRDEALANEGTTAGGDSGGPLILDAANNPITDEDLVIGVLSGGSRFFGPQPFSTYGTTSFYQPLFLYWDYIVATNPYRYVTAKAGDGDWEDGSHWETTLDPVYRIIDENGAIVNGLPTTIGAGRNGTDPDFGEICFDPAGPTEICQDLATGVVTDGQTTAPGVTTVSGRAFVGTDLFGSAEGNNIGNLHVGNGLSSEDISAPAVVSLTSSEQAPQGINGGSPEFSDTPLPPATLANGLPGATDFVPDNIDAVVSADPAVNVEPRYFDVTLGNAGTTTLSSEVTIDRLTIRGAAGLNVAADGDLTSLIDINQFGGRVNVDGALTSVGDYSLFGGVLEGSGTINAPFLTNLVGAISPGATGNIDTLTVNGNVILSSGSTLLIDIDAAGNADTLAVTGAADVGGVVGVGIADTTQAFGNGQQYTIVTADGGVTGAFEESQLSAILSQSFTYEANAVLMTIDASSYSTVIDPSDPAQVAYAQLFDQNRGTGALSELYALDFADVDTIRDTFSSLAPVAEQAVRTHVAQSIYGLQTFNDRRLSNADRSKAGGKIAKVGSPLETAQIGFSPNRQPIGPAAMALQGGDDTETTDANLPDNMALFVAGGLTQGEGDSMPGFAPTTTNLQGYYLAGGAEFYTGERSVIGLSGYYSDIEGDTVLGQETGSELLGASIYARIGTSSGLVIDGQASVASIDLSTNRTVSLLGNQQTLTSDSEDTLFSGAIGLSYDIETGAGTFSPGIEGRYARASLSQISETGGTLALQIDREDFTSTQARAGFDYQVTKPQVQVNAKAQMVYEFEDGPQLLGAQFAQGVGPNANFALGGNDEAWVELGVGASLGDGPMRIGLDFDTTVGRDNANAFAFSASATYSF